MLVLLNVLSTSRKLAAARNFLAVNLEQERVIAFTECTMIDRNSLGGPTTSVFVIRHGKHPQRKVLDIGGASSVVVDGVSGADFRLHLLKIPKKSDQDVSRGCIFYLEANPQLRSIVCT
jgi:hypothetical protein